MDVVREAAHVRGAPRGVLRLALELEDGQRATPSARLDATGAGAGLVAALGLTVLAGPILGRGAPALYVHIERHTGKPEIRKRDSERDASFRLDSARCVSLYTIIVARSPPSVH